MKNRKRVLRRLCALAFWGVALIPLTAKAQLKGYLKIEDIPGESVSVDHEDEIDFACVKKYDVARTIQR